MSEGTLRLEQSNFEPSIPHGTVLGSVSLLPTALDLLDEGIASVAGEHPSVKDI
jgi:hypothetical protein